MATYRGGDDYRNAVGGVDARYQKDEHTLRGQWLRSESEYPDGHALPDTAPKGDALYLNYSYGNIARGAAPCRTRRSIRASGPTSGSSRRWVTTSR